MSLTTWKGKKKRRKRRTGKNLFSPFSWNITQKKLVEKTDGKTDQKQTDKEREEKKIFFFRYSRSQKTEEKISILSIWNIQKNGKDQYENTRIKTHKNNQKKEKKNPEINKKKNTIQNPEKYQWDNITKYHKRETIRDTHTQTAD